MKFKVVALAVILMFTVSGCGGLPSESDTSASTPRGDMTFKELTQTADYQTLIEDSCDSAFTSTVQNLDFLEIGQGQVVSSKAQVMISRTERLEKSLTDNRALSSILREALEWHLEAGDSSLDWTTPSKLLDDYLLKQLEITLVSPLLQGDAPKSPEVLNQISENWINTCKMELAISQAREVTQNFEDSLNSATATFKKQFLDNGYRDFGIALAKLKITGDTAILELVSTDWCTPVAGVVVQGKADADGIAPPQETATLPMINAETFVAVKSNYSMRLRLNRDTSKYDVRNGELVSVRCL